ncbi:stage II sporulation protein M [Hyperthermus butylicus]|uniref:Membrane protein n=1 Tax=Hyperthermus butylicus (strain DSM 5456 / JCM 9403 / PLM1-5) TaxID=415426 RepID=A2BJJ9_HYPBU|nr:stage II sporulation protein M [Hyperthermus butylicus]ABM80160.1 putative membrane protein [Hyperthermus butylicus DSM 5456]
MTSRGSSGRYSPALVYLAALLVFLAAAAAGSYYASVRPSDFFDYFMEVAKELPKAESVSVIYLHNLMLSLKLVAPYAVAKLILRRRARPLLVVLALVPLLVPAVNGFVLGGTLACPLIQAAVAPGCRPGSVSAVLVTASLILPHGVLEIPAMVALAAAPLAAEFARNGTRWAVLMAVAGAVLLLLAALVEVYVTMAVYEFAWGLLCG